MSNTVNISNEQVQQAAASGAKLLSDDERVSIPPSMAMSGDLAILMTCLNGLANGTIMLGNPPPADPILEDDIPEGDPE